MKRLLTALLIFLILAAGIILLRTIGCSPVVEEGLRQVGSLAWPESVLRIPGGVGRWVDGFLGEARAWEDPAEEETIVQIAGTGHVVVREDTLSVSTGIQITEDDVIISTVVEGEPVVWDTLQAVIQLPERSRFTVILETDGKEMSGGLGYRLFEINDDTHIGIAVTTDIPEFDWVAGSIRAERQIVGELSGGVQYGYQVGENSGDRWAAGLALPF